MSRCFPEAWRLGTGGVPEIRESFPKLQESLVRGQHPNILRLDLSRANFRDVDLQGADLYRCWLVEADFQGANLRGAVPGEVTAGGAKFDHAILAGSVMMKGSYVRARFRHADFCSKGPQGGTKEQVWWANKPTMLNDADVREADFTRAQLASVVFKGVNLTGADLSRANLRGADLQLVQLVDVNVEHADFHGARIYGLSAWNLRGRPKDQSGLVVSADRQPATRPRLSRTAHFVPILRSKRLGEALDAFNSKVRI